MTNGDTDQEGLTFLNVLTLFLSIYVLIALVIDTVFVLPAETSRLLNYIDVGICLVFLIDFVQRFRQAPNKLRFMRWGWIDLISSIPMLEVMRYGRILRLIRLIRIVRAFRSLQKLIDHVFKNRAQGALTSVSTTAAMLVIVASVAILQVENSPDSNIRTAEDAIWWAYVTITTVGYGDKFPVTTEGRVIAAILMTAGVGVFGTFAAYLASLFVAPTARKEEEAS
ncbi:MAG: ion transporter [Flavobacteriales bacterium]|nr:potassium channel family protein [Flavobacteriales bacterium]